MTHRVRPLSGVELPVRLRDLPEPPEVVFVAGELPRVAAVAIVGTRRPTVEGVAFAHRLAFDLVKEGVAVLSGGAFGIDTAAHRGALEGGGPTVVVAPSSFDRPYPQENAELFSQIVEQGGAYLALSESDTAARPDRFFRRNALLAALSHALVVVETRCRGGARNAASAARRLGRPVLAVPHAPWSSSGGGCILELKAGARVVASARDVLRVLALEPRTSASEWVGAREDPSAQRADPGGTDASRQLSLDDWDAARPIDQRAGGPAEERDALVELLRLGPLWPDEICRALDVPASRVQALLLTLTLESVVVSEPSGRVTLVTNRND